MASLWRYGYDRRSCGSPLGGWCPACRPGHLAQARDEPKGDPLFREILKDRFGFDAFKPGQEAVIETLVSGRSAAAIFPTGAGKSLCYQLPALNEPGMTLVISPLLSLMKDQLEFLQARNIPAAKLDSGMPLEAYRDVLAAARQGQLKILMIAVERFKNERFQTQLQQIDVSLLVVDEAHCISQWGHNFRPDYLKIPIFQTEFGIPKVLLLTATATPAVIEEMCAKFSIAPEHVVRTGFYRSNLALEVRPAARRARDQALLETLETDPRGAAIVYTTLQKTAEQVARTLTSQGVKAEPYHAGLKAELRDAVQNRFLSGQTEVVAATIAFGMGIDKADIRKVIHYDLPKSMESYSQEVGRAGRDGAPALCRVLADRGGVPLLENFVYGDTPPRQGIETLLRRIQTAPGRHLDLRLHALSRDTDIRLLPLKTLLVYLELEDILRPKTTYFEAYPFRYRITPVELGASFEGERQAFVNTIVAHCNTAQIWTYPDIEAIQKASGSERRRVLSALEYFDTQGWIELKPKSAVEVYQIVKADFDLNALTRQLERRFTEKEAEDVARIHRMLAIFEDRNCLAQGLSAHFGETLERSCGRCGTCRTGEPPDLGRPAPTDLKGFAYGELLGDLEKVIAPPLPVHLAARFLCGISTPWLVNARASRIAGFGRLDRYPYKGVEAWVAEHRPSR